MPQFELEGRDNPEFADLPMIAQGYVEAMFFTECDPSVSLDEWEEEPGMEFRDGSIPGDVGFSHLHPDAVKDIVAECGAFHVKARDLLRKAYERDYDATQAGRDFWYTRNGHGVGFWDRDALDADDLGDALSVIAREFGEAHVWIGDHVDHGNAPFIHHQ